MKSRKQHYFIDGQSLCKQWEYGGPYDECDHAEPNCAECGRQLAKLCKAIVEIDRALEQILDTECVPEGTR